MNVEDQLEILVQYCSGKPVEYCPIEQSETQRWKRIDRRINHHNFNFEVYLYRVMEEPMEIKIWINREGRVFHLAETIPNKKYLEDGGFVLRRFREII